MKPLVDPAALFSSELKPRAIGALNAKILVNRRPLPKSFYLCDTSQVARGLLGKCLVHKVGRVVTAGIIVETEAYLHRDDQASHSARGMTARNRSMFLEGGTCYVYLSYGLNYCVNVVTRSHGIGEAVLIRALRPIAGIEAMARNREFNAFENAKNALRLTNGPGKLAQALGLTVADDGRSLCSPTLKIVDLRIAAEALAVETTARVGITRSAELPLRFLIKPSPWVSRGRPST